MIIKVGDDQFLNVPVGTVDEILSRLQRKGIDTRGATLRDEDKVTERCMHIPLRNIIVLYTLSEAATFKSEVSLRVHIQADNDLTAFRYNTVKPLIKATIQICDV